MNILVIGNRFDLAHGLPTRYTDFLKWIVGQHDFFYTLKKQDSQITKLRECISLRIPEEANRKVISQRITHQEEIWNCIDDNFWIGYFLQNPMYQKENWIDFENEISKVIKSVDADMKGNIEKKISYEKLSNEYLKDCFMTYDDLFERVDGVEEDTPRKSFGELRDKLLNDLNCNDFKIRYAMGGSIRPPYSFNSVRSFGLNCIFPHNRCTLFFIGHTTHSPSIFPALIFISVCVRSL